MKSISRKKNCNRGWKTGRFSITLTAVDIVIWPHWKNSTWKIGHFSLCCIYHLALEKPLPPPPVFWSILIVAKKSTFVTCSLQKNSTSFALQKNSTSFAHRKNSLFFITRLVVVDLLHRKLNVFIHNSHQGPVIAYKPLWAQSQEFDGGCFFVKSISRKKFYRWYFSDFFRENNL